MLAGDLLGAYCLSEAHAGSDPSAMRTRARRDGDDYVINGAKAWTTHGGHADFYKVMARTSDERNGISCFLVPADTEGLVADPPERKMGLTGSATATMRFEDVRVPAERLLGNEGDGLKIALAGLDSGRLGIAAVAVGLGQAALDHAVAYAGEREQFGQKIIDFQGLAFLLADMEAAVQSARAMMLHAARLKDRGLPFSREASIAKLTATDAAMKVTTDAVQVLGGYGYTRDFPVERFMREAKVTQIFEGTNQIQRLVISRSLTKDRSGRLHTDPHRSRPREPDDPPSSELHRRRPPRPQRHPRPGHRRQLRHRLPHRPGARRPRRRGRPRLPQPRLGARRRGQDARRDLGRGARPGLAEVDPRVRRPASRDRWTCWSTTPA